MPTGSIRNVTPWSADEARTFLETARHDRLYALWAVALAIGLRRGEALGLRWVDVDLVNGRAVISKALQRVGMTWPCEASKLNRRPPPFRCRRSSWRSCGGVALISSATPTSHRPALGLLFTTQNGTPLEPRNVNGAFETLCRRAGVCADCLQAILDGILSRAPPNVRPLRKVGRFFAASSRS
jgi:integrase